MTKSPDISLREWTLPEGSLIKIGGIPYELTAATVVRGNSDPTQVVAQVEIRNLKDSSAQESPHE
ncbi:hypothetical protein BOTU111921_11335 [Bordetella tumbae]